MALAGDRDDARGPLGDNLANLESGLLQTLGYYSPLPCVAGVGLKVDPIIN